MNHQQSEENKEKKNKTRVQYIKLAAPVMIPLPAGLKFSTKNNGKSLVLEHDAGVGQVNVLEETLKRVDDIAIQALKQNGLLSHK
jgi:hypothetical protein